MLRKNLKVEKNSERFVSSLVYQDALQRNLRKLSNKNNFQVLDLGIVNQNFVGLGNHSNLKKTKHKLNHQHKDQKALFATIVGNRVIPVNTADSKEN